jgi:hypothetical protein
LPALKRDGYSKVADRAIVRAFFHALVTATAFFASDTRLGPKVFLSVTIEAEAASDVD